MAKNVPAIGIEVVLRHTSLQMKLVEMSSTVEGVEVTNFAIVDLPPGGLRLIGPSLRNVLKEQGFGAKVISAIIPYPSIDYRQVSLPPMSKGDLRTAGNREAGKDIKFPVEELVTDSEIVGESEEKGLHKTELLLATAQTKDIDDFFSMADEFRIKFSSLTVVPAALHNLLRLRGDTGEGTLAMVHAGTDKGTVVISHHGNLRFPREFPLRRGAETEESSELTARLVAETKRSLLFAKQQARGLTVERILVLGDMLQPEIIANALSSETGIHAEVYAPLGLDLSPLGERVHEFRESLPVLSVALGLAWTGPEHSTLNLLAPRLTEQKKASVAKRALAATSAMLAVLLVAYYVLLLFKEAPYKEDYTLLNRELASLRPKTRDLREMQRERDMLDARRAFIGKMYGPVTPWSEILRTLSLSVPNEMLLHSVDVEEADTGWTIKINGEVTGSDAAFVQKKFRRFFSLLLTNPSLSKGEIESFVIRPVSVGGGAVGTKASKLEFTVSAHVKTKETTGGGTKG